jgi:hypothetical protein
MKEFQQIARDPGQEALVPTTGMEPAPARMPLVEMPGPGLKRDGEGVRVLADDSPP